MITNSWKRPRWLQIRLSTAVVIMFASGLIILLNLGSYEHEFQDHTKIPKGWKLHNSMRGRFNMGPRRARVRGWPFMYYHYSAGDWDSLKKFQYDSADWDVIRLIYNLCISGCLLLLLIVACEIPHRWQEDRQLKPTTKD